MEAGYGTGRIGNAKKRAMILPMSSAVRIETEADRQASNWNALLPENAKWETQIVILSPESALNPYAEWGLAKLDPCQQAALD
jgi:hypothetical protein